MPMVGSDIVAIQDISRWVARCADALALQCAVEGDVIADTYAEKVGSLVSYIDTASLEPYQRAKLLSAIVSFSEKAEIAALLAPIDTFLRVFFGTFSVVNTLRANNEYLEPETAYLVRRLVGAMPADVVFAPAGTFLQRETGWGTLGSASIASGNLTYTEESEIPAEDYAGALVMLVVNAQGSSDTVIRVTARKYNGATDIIQKTIPGDTAAGEFELLSNSTLYVAVDDVELVSGGNDGDSYSFTTKRWRELSGGET